MTVLLKMNLLDILQFFITIIFLFIVLSYYVLILIKKKEVDSKRKVSSVTVIIPVHNEERYIQDAIDSTIKAYFKGQKDIIVVDDGSTDSTAKIAKAYENKGVKLISTKHSGKSASINRALKIAKGELVAIVDGDSCIHEDALQEMSDELLNQNAVGACGVVKVKNRKKPICMWMHIEQLYNSLMRLLFSKLNANIVTPGPLSMYKRKELLELGGFSTEGFSEDIDITIRLIRKGHKIVFAEKAVAETNMPSDAKGFFNQRTRFARGMINMLKRHMDFNNKFIDFYTLPILLFSYIQAVLMGIFIIYQIISGYVAYFASKGVYLSFHVLKFFLEWFSVIGFVRWVASVLSGQTPFTFITLVGIISTLLTYPLYFLAIIKFDKKIDLWHLIPIFFMFPFWLLIMIIYTIMLPEYFRKQQYNIWKKNE